jgi:exopolyphosphatase/guanosine-5'-triphosphate,3'-diphosphate pyrophosphatase
MIFAAIDIGTNTVLLLAARVSGDGHITPLLYEQRIPRLGAGVDSRRHLAPDSMRRVTDVLGEYRSLMRTFDLEAVAVCATSAVRDAVNRDEFLNTVQRDTGFTVEVLSGDEEAHWTYRGAISGFHGIDRATVVDIGGGSTEVTVGTGTAIAGRVSMDLGAVRLTERILRGDPPTPGQLSKCRAAIDEGLQPLSTLDVRGSTLIGVAGTATTLATLHQGLREFDLAAVSGYRLPGTAVDALVSQLSAMPSRKIRALSSILEGRADIIVAGSMILQQIMHLLNAPEITVSERGVRYGLVLREWERAMSGKR